ncbi:ras-related protein Rap-1b-like [Haliotis cracherodii]|uniref:ras-related protein Rap-1b-like n=1 Tax=Haliotis rufescens TaxID=6454 RepID=UPI001EAFAD69|nr:ras-related protein Rap-1b-like [Haliotis rufescens]XP_046363417.1 ras-related protein Rap-1b-like [Haliotis rufescens]
MLSSGRPSTGQLCPRGGHRLPKSRAHYRIVVMGAAAVGKSAIISQFLYDRFVKEYKATVEDLHRGEYDVNGMHLILDILDTSGTHSFPAMRKLAIATGDAFVLVYSVDDDSSFSAVKQLRDEIIEEKNSEDVPIVIAANKTDVTEERRVIGRETAETLVCIEWGNGYIEASAKDNINIVGIFKEILRQSNIQYALSPAVRRRRRSMPAVLVQRRQLDPPKRHSCSLN